MKHFNTYVNGNKVYWDDEEMEWYYLDGELLDNNFRPYPNCNQLPTKDGHDSCIANLPGIKFACCGHGIKKGGGYLSFNDDRKIYADTEPKLFRKTIEKLKKARQ